MERYILKTPLPDGRRPIIEKVSKRLQDEKGCARYYIFSFVKDNRAIEYNLFSLTEKQLNKLYEPLNRGE